MTMLDEPAQLLRLRRLREQRALHAHARARARRDEAQQQVDRRRGELAAFDRDLAALLRMIATADVTALLRGMPYASARRDDLAYRRERCEYELIDDEEALGAAQTVLDDAARDWHAARTRADAAADLLQRLRAAAARAAEQRLERDTSLLRRIAGQPEPLAAHALNRPLSSAFSGARA
jgi:hypothetical protein